VSSFVHIDNAAAATAAAVESERDRMGVYNIVDDEPAQVAGWRPAYASWRTGFSVGLGNSEATRAA
jgi:nucleoside-diphosphate-sugar epimerase